jgi:hypothetical protein
MPLLARCVLDRCWRVVFFTVVGALCVGPLLARLDRRWRVEHVDMHCWRVVGTCILFSQSINHLVPKFVSEFLVNVNALG